MGPLLLTLAAVSFSACDRGEKAPDEVRITEAKEAVAQEAFPSSAPDATQLPFPTAVGDRAEFIRGVDLTAAPEKFHGKRVILAGTWTWAWEVSSFELDDVRPTFRIWTEFDWKQIGKPYGDFAESKQKLAGSRLNDAGFVSYHVVAEGSFHFRSDAGPRGSGRVPGFGHFGASPACFVIDRLFEFEPLTTKDPNKAVDPPPETTLRNP